MNSSTIEFPASASDPIRSLIQRLSIGSEGAHARSIAFVAARAREGTSTIAWEYAKTLAAETDQKVLLIDAGAADTDRYRDHDLSFSSGMVDAVLAGQPASAVIKASSQGIWVACWVGAEKNRTFGGRALHDAALWKGLSNSFDSIIIDAPSLQFSFDGIALAAKAEATVIVIEAESTPEPVVKNLQNKLTASGATIVGTIMNKRRYYIPEKIYKRL